MTEKQYRLNKWGTRLLKNNRPLFDWANESDDIVDLLNELADENEQLKKDRFICLDCEHSGYTEIGCLCEKKDCWTDYKIECEDYEELE